MAAARSAVFVASVRVAGGLRGVSVRLNGHTVSFSLSGDGGLTAWLSAGNGLRPGVNRLRVEADKPGARVRVDAVSQFVVAYPSARLIGLSSGSFGAGGGSVAPRLRVPTSGVTRMSIVLNGRDVTTALVGRPVADGSKLLELSAAQGLRWGHNALAVSVLMFDGRRQSARRAFELDRRHDIAGLRLRSVAHVGRLVRLDAGSSMVVKGRLRDATIRWTLIGRPLRSRAVISGRGKQASFKADVPGWYRVRVTVDSTAGGSRASASAVSADSATMSVPATYSNLLVPLNSIDSGTPSAVAIGSNRYFIRPCPKCIPNPDPYVWLQVNVFDRTTLGYLGGEGFDVSSSGIAAMGTYLKSLPNTDLVFVTHPSTSPTIALSDIGALNTALGYIGGSYPGYWQLDQTCWSGQTDACDQNSATKTGWVNRATAAIGSFSIAGVPGMSAGQAWRATAPQSRSTEGRISGYLTPGVDQQTGLQGGYVIVAGDDQYAEVDTCASGGPSECVIRVGDQTFAPTPGVNGFNVVTLDRTTLGVINHATATSVGDMESDIGYEPSGYLQLGRQLVPNSVDDQKIVIIQSVGTGIIPSGSTDSMYPYIDWFGGTPELFKAAITNGTPYAMVGVADNPPWHGTAVESSPIVSSQQTGRLRTVLSRNHDWLYTPSAGDPYGQTNLDLYSIIYQDPTPWPYEGDPAIAYIATNLNLNTDVRSDYVNTNINFASKAAILASLTCSDTSACGPNFDAVKKQLLNEFDWVESVRSLIANLQYPFVVDQQSQPINVQDVYDEISATVKPPPSTSQSWGWLGMFLKVATLAQAVAFEGGASETGNVLGLITSSGQFVADSVSKPNGDSSETLSGTVQQLDQQLAQEEIAYIQSTDQLGAILVSDAGKLQTVGVKVGTDPAWDWNEGSSLSDAVTALNASSRASSYAAMLPPTWGVWNLKGAGQSPPTSDNVATYQCAGLSSGPVAIWANAPTGNQLHAVYSTSQSEVWTFSNLYNITNGGFNNSPYKNVTVPSQSLTDNLTSTNTQTGAFQYLPQWLRATYNPPGAVSCTPIPGGASLAWGPPVIPNASAAADQ